MYLIGDIHGLFSDYNQMVSTIKEPTIQLGDFGIGFNSLYGMTNNFSNLKNMFIRGNHDNPNECKNHPNYLGDFGMYENIFFISGAWSIDKHLRIQDVNWWEDEELSMSDCQNALNLYESEKPEIIISHDCPISIINHIYSHPINTRTGQLLQNMFEIHQPVKWFFGHHHKSIKLRIDKTDFRCLTELEMVKLEM